MRPPESFSTFSIHGLCIDSHTCDCGAMKVWNLSVTVCCARPDNAGAPRAAPAMPCRRERRFIEDSVNDAMREGSGKRAAAGLAFFPTATHSIAGPLADEGHEP